VPGTELNSDADDSVRGASVIVVNVSGR
jgi:hypothetical protein